MSSTAGSKRTRANGEEDSCRDEREVNVKKPWRLVSDIASRCSEEWLPEFLRDDAAKAGVTGTDAWLVSLGRSLVGALGTLPAQAETARAKLGAVRAALVAATLRCDTIKEQIDDAEMSKTANLERELCAVDEALTQLRAARVAAAPVLGALVSSLSSASAASAGEGETAIADATRLELELKHVEDKLRNLPTCVMEIPIIDFVAHKNALDVGAVVVPRAATAKDFVVDKWKHPQMHFKLRSERTEARSDDELVHTLRTAAEAARGYVWIERDGSFWASLTSAVSWNLETRCLVVSVDDETRETHETRDREGKFSFPGCTAWIDFKIAGTWACGSSASRKRLLL